MKREIDITDYIPTGHENGVHMSGLEAITGLDARTIRRLVQNARNDGHIILNINSERTGYFIPALPEEKNYLQMWLAQEKSKAVAIFTARVPAYSLWKEMQEDGRAQDVCKNNN